MKRSGLDTVMMLRLIAGYSSEHEGVDPWKLFGDLMSGRVAPSPDIPSRLPGVPYKVVLAKLEQLGRQRLIDWGVVITRPWLTPEGEAILRAGIVSAPGSPGSA